MLASMHWTVNDAVEKSHSEHLLQHWVEFFQTKPMSSFSLPVFLKYFHCKYG